MKKHNHLNLMVKPLYSGYKNININWLQNEWNKQVFV